MRPLVVPLLLALVIAGCGQRQAAAPAPDPAPVPSTVELPPAATRSPAAPAPADPAVPAAATPRADPAPIPLPLADDPRYRETLQLALESLRTADAGERDVALMEVGDAAFEARDYARAETAMRALADRWPDEPWVAANLSVALGKQGRWSLALAEAERAERLPGANAMHCRAIRASWLWHLGRRDEARALFAAIPPPPEASDDRELWHACRACFAASAGDLETLRDGIARLRDAGGDAFEFVQRDVVFDPYRGEPWFTELVGETLAQEL